MTHSTLTGEMSRGQGGCNFSCYYCVVSESLVPDGPAPEGPLPDGPLGGQPSGPAGHKGPAPVAKTGDSMLFDALWTGVVNDWDNEARHTKFLDHAHRSNELPRAASLYRALTDDADRGAVAQKQIKTVELLVVNQMIATKSTREPGIPGWVYALMVAVCASLLGCALYWAWTGGSGQ